MKKYYQKKRNVKEVKHIKLHEKNIYKIYYRDLDIMYVNDDFDESIYDSKIIVVR